MKISTVNLYTATTGTTVNEQFLKTTTDSSFSLPAGTSFFTLRKMVVVVDNVNFDGYRLWLVTNPTSSATSLTVSASADEPAYYLSYNDAALQFNSCIGILDNEDFLIQVFGGQGGTGANSRHETWLFFPNSEYDFSPLINDIEHRLNP